MIPLWSAVPFVLLLLGIAVMPLAFGRFWESHRNRGVFVALLSLPVLLWLWRHHPAEAIHTLHEYLSFIALLGSLFVIAGGIHLSGDLKASPVVNAAFLGLGAVLANLIGTTGASMVLIRPFLKTNSERKKVGHLPLFFIFIVSNCGGMLTPLGDPPLFLGYLRGVPFFWTLRLFPYWAFMTGALLVIFYLWDVTAYRKEKAEDLRRDAASVKPLRLHGGVNFLFLAGVLGAVFLEAPGREAVMAGMAAASLLLGGKAARRWNAFSWGPILEVAVLFAGIFITMVPALMLLREAAPLLGVREPWQFFWLTGGLSSFLDNAPTYLTFLSIAQGLNLPADVVGVPQKILEAISVGAVLMGANTYIGNGPNFMVKAIADRSGFKMPSFGGYFLYALVILFPLYGVLHLIFF